MFACLVCTIGASSRLFPHLRHMSTRSGRIFQAMNTETAREDRDGAREMAEGDGVTCSLGIARHDLDDEGCHNKEIKGLTPSGRQSGASQSSPPAVVQREARPKRQDSWPSNMS